MEFKDSNACATSQCLNGGTCIPGINSFTYTCQCASGYSGNNCQTCIINILCILKKSE